MKTTSIGIQNLCAPCFCACKYCLLQSCKTADSVDYFRGKKVAEKFVSWAKEKPFSPLPYYYIAYCAEYPELLDTIYFNKSVGFVGAKFLQCNGIKMRNLAELNEWVKNIKTAGIELIDTTFFGDKEYHDRFAARQGDFDFMFQLASCVSSKGIKCSPSVVITKDNLCMLVDLINKLNQIPNIGRIGSFLPDYRGRGYLIESSRITISDYKSLSDTIKNTFNINRYKTQKEWLALGLLPEYTQRAITITLRNDNIEMFENMSCDEIVSYVENLDDEYYKVLPTINELAKMYGDKECEKLYRLRDLFWMWQKRYIKENNIEIYNVTDERLCNTVRS